MRKHLFLVALVLLSVASLPLDSCGNRKKAEMEVISPDRFPFVQVPDMIDTKEDAAKYYALNYWKDFLDENRLLQVEYSKDSTGVLGVSGKVFRDAFIGYIKALEAANHYATAAESERDLMAKADTIATYGSKIFFGKIIEYSEKYLYEPNSPLLDEQIYVPILEGIISSKSMTSEQKLPYIYQYKMATLNMIGARANNFSFSENGERSYLYDIDAEYTLIYFNNPECSDCKRVLEMLENSEALNNMIGQDRLTVLSLYPDKNLSIWRKARREFPSDWINAYDPSGAINAGKIYSLRAIPSLYLLNSDKVVILKDAKPEKVLKYLSDLLYSSDAADLHLKIANQKIQEAMDSLQ